MQLNKLRAKIVEMNFNMNKLAEDTSMSKITLYRKLNGLQEFKISEIRTLKEILELSPDEINEIFFK